MYIVILSMLVFAIPLIILYFAYLCNNMRLKELKFDLEISKETSKNLEYIYYKLLEK